MQEERALQMRAARIRKLANVAASVLVQEFQATEVYLFGSLVDGPRHSAFDVDLAATGVAPERYFAALARISEVLGEHVDLVPLESCVESLRKRILTKGIRLDGR